MTVEWLRWYGLITILVALVAGLFVIFKYPRESASSISALIAARQRSFIAMAVVLSITSTMFHIFVVLWLVPSYHLPSFLFALIGISCVASLCLAWSKENNRHEATLSHRVHTTSSLIVATAMTILLTTLLFSYQKLQPLSQLSLLLTWVYSLAFVLLGLYKKHQRIRDYMLWYEMGFILLFWLTIIFMIYKV